MLMSIFFPPVTWTQDGQDIREKDGLKLDRTVSHALLTVKDVKLANSGEYALTASNKYGTKTVSCKVHVLGEFIIWYSKFSLYHLL